MTNFIPEKFVNISAERIQSLIEENRLLKEEIRVSREAADITGKLVVKQFEETEKFLHRFQESEKKYRLLINSLPNIVGKGYVDGSIDLFDDKIESLTGFSKEDFLTRKIKWTDIIVKEDIGNIKRIFSLALKTDRLYVREYRIRSKSGEIVWIQEGSQILCDENGEIEFITGSLLNITKRKLAEEALQKAHHELEMRVGERTAELAQANKELKTEINERRHAEEALRKSEEKYRGIFENAAGGIYQSTPGGQILTANSAFVKIMGYESEEDLTDSVTDLRIQFYADPQARHELQKLFREHEVVKDFETRFYQKDGSLIDVSLSARMVRDENRNLIYYEGFLEDITERKHLEELKTAKDAAEASARAKSRFLANMSHEIRTPLNAIIGLTDLSLGSDDHKTFSQIDCLAKIKLSSHTLLGIINDILDFSKIEAGKLDIESADFHLYDVMDNLSDLFSNIASEKGIEIIFSVADDVPKSLVGDPLRLGQVLTNLTNNAVKFTEEGEVTVKVDMVSSPHPGTAEQTKDNVRLRFTVRDTGIGIPSQYMPRLFTSFSQADDSTGRKYGGTGLGLAICKHLVEMMKGNIQVKSVKGKGTTFCFTAVFGLQSQGKYRKPLIPDDLYGTRVLVVDDNETSREIFTEILKSFSFEATSVDSGKAALEELRRAESEEPYSIVLMDWMMPEMDGITALKRIRTLSGSSQIPVIMMTAFGRKEVMQQAEAAGVNGFLIKPVKQSLLFDTIVNAFSRRTAEAGEQTPGLISETKPEIYFTGARVLLTEDNAINRQVATEILERAGIIVKTAKNGEEAVQRVIRDEYDAVIMDVQMPKMDGYEATQAIRLWENCHSSSFICDPSFPIDKTAIPIIAMTAHAMKGDRERCIAAGMNDYVSKPIDVDQLFSVLGKWLKMETRNLKQETRNLKLETRNSDFRFSSSLPGIDVESALERLGGNEDMFRELLLEFGRDYEDAADKIRDMLARGDTEAICRLAHTLKGVAGNFSAKGLYAAAIELNTAALRGNFEDIGSLLNYFEDALGQVVSSALSLKYEDEEGLSHVHGTSDPEGVQNWLLASPEEASLLLIRLAELLRKNDLDAEEHLISVKACFSDFGFRDPIKKLEDHINRLDFDAALKTLNRIAQSLDISLEGDRNE